MLPVQLVDVPDTRILSVFGPGIGSKAAGTCPNSGPKTVLFASGLWFWISVNTSRLGSKNSCSSAESDFRTGNAQRSLFLNCMCLLDCAVRRRGHTNFFLLACVPNIFDALKMTNSSREHTLREKESDSAHTLITPNVQCQHLAACTYCISSLQASFGKFHLVLI